MVDLNEVQGVAALKKQDMSVISLVAIIYCAVAAGAFGVEEMIQGCGPGMTIILLTVLALAWALPICFGISELASLMPCEGGFYYWAKKGFGEFWGFQVGWWNAIGFHVCGGSYVVLAVNYLSTLVPMTDSQALAVKIGIVIIFAIVNLMGIKEVGLLSTIFSTAILIAFAVVTVVDFAHWNYSPIDPVVPKDMTMLYSIGQGIGLGIWMYTGWGCITFIAGEIKNANVIPKALFVVVPLTALTYLLPTIAGLAAIGQWENWTTVGANGVGFSTVLTQYMGPAFGIIFLGIAIIGQISIYNTNVAGGSRTFFVLADDNLFPKFVNKVSRRRGVPYVGIISLSLVSIVLVQFSFVTLVLIQVVCALGTYIMSGAIILKVRKKVPVSEREGCFTIPGGKLGLYLCVICPIVVAVAALYLNGMDYFLIGLTFIILTGPILYIVFKRKYGGLAVMDAENYPLNPKTKLAEGDIPRMATFLLIVGGLAFVGSFLLRYIEQSWGPEYYSTEYAGAGILSGLSSFEGMLSTLRIGGIICLALAFVFYLVAKRMNDGKKEFPQ